MLEQGIFKKGVLNGKRDKEKIKEKAAWECESGHKYGSYKSIRRNWNLKCGKIFIYLQNLSFLKETTVKLTNRKTFSIQIKQLAHYFCTPL